MSLLCTCVNTALGSIAKLFFIQNFASSPLYHLGKHLPRPSAISYPEAHCHSFWINSSRSSSTMSANSLSMRKDLPGYSQLEMPRKALHIMPVVGTQLMRLIRIVDTPSTQTSRTVGMYLYFSKPSTSAQEILAEGFKTVLRWLLTSTVKRPLPAESRET